MSEDGYRRGRGVQRDRKRSPVKPLYRPLLLWLWVIGAILLVIAVGFGLDAGLAVVVVMHIFFGGLIYGDIKSIRRQGVEWGLSRHLWFGAAIALPFVVPAYYLYSGRVVRRANRERGYVGEVSAESSDGSETVDEDDAGERGPAGDG